MCGIFGAFSEQHVPEAELRILVDSALRRGRDESSLIYYKDDNYVVKYSDKDIKQLFKSQKNLQSRFVIGHSRLITNGVKDRQPVIRNSCAVLHNGIIVNEKEIWQQLSCTRHLTIDSEVILGIMEDNLSKGLAIDVAIEGILNVCKGTLSAAIAIAPLGKIYLLSNNGSLYIGKKQEAFYFTSESYPLELIGCEDIHQLKNDYESFDIPIANIVAKGEDDLLKPSLSERSQRIYSEERLLKHVEHNLRRCNRCILPETMPFINFDERGICNYCNNYIARNSPRKIDELLKIVEPYRKDKGPECIIPFSGGRDSCYGLHLIVNELKLRPLTYTYDWGMVTDIGRRNISRFCSKLGIENIIVAANIANKRRNIAMNLDAWLKSPHLGMISILTAGDKHFFRHIESTKKRTGVKLNLWAINPLEVTHFKAGFLGVPPYFDESAVYMRGLSKQLLYQSLRLRAMLDSPGYLNLSLWDTISGEYFRSFTNKKDYFHIFDYWRWDETECNEILDIYEWEKAEDTTTTWRIGDGTAAFYNYIYYTIAGFSEHDTFRSNQIREGQLNRAEALALVKTENQPRYQSIKWYLDSLEMDFADTIKTINAFKKLYVPLI